MQQLRYATTRLLGRTSALRACADAPERIFGIQTGYNFPDTLGVQPATARGTRS